MKPGLKGWLIVVTVFVLGGATGGGINHVQSEKEISALLSTPWPRYMRERRLAIMARRLSLSERQREQIREIMHQDGPQFWKAMRTMTQTCGEPFKIAKERNDARIAAVLDESQRAEFQKMIAEHQQ